MLRPLLALCSLLVACAPAPDGDAGDGSGGAIDAASGAAPSSLAGALAGQDCVVVLLDALHAAFLSSYGSRRPTSPRIDALAARGVRFARAWSQTSWTLASTASLMTGLYQETHGVELAQHALADEARTLAELFSAAGHRTYAFVQNPYAGRAHGFGQGVDVFVEAPDAADEELVAQVLAALAEPAAAPRFVYLHLRRPHSPYDPDPAFLEPFGPSDYDGFVTGSNEDIQRHNDQTAFMDADDVRELKRLYAGGIRQADAALGALLDGLDTARTLVVVLSDHGDAMNQHGYLGHNWYSSEEMVHVPLILAHPALPQGLVVEAPVMTIDVLPTLVELFGLPAPGLAQGTSLVELLASGRAPARPAIFTSSRTNPGGAQQLAAFDGRFKYVLSFPQERARLFDLVAEPIEWTNVAEQHPDVLERLGQLVRDWQTSAREQRIDAAQRPPLDAAAEEHLRALGYLGGDGGR